MRGPRSVNISNQEHREMQSQRTGERFSFSAVISDHFGFKDVFIHHEILPPGRRSSSPHAHTHREELVFVLKGDLTAFFKGEKYRLHEGDFFGFPPGVENTHLIENESESVAEFLVIASNPQEDQVLFQDAGR